MSDLLAERLKALTPEQRTLFELRKRERDSAAAVPSVIPRLPLSAQTAVPLSFAQQRLWFLHRLDPVSPLYNTFLTARLTGPLDRQALGNALDEMVNRHQVLRTTFAFENGQPVQILNPTARLPMRELSLAHLSGSEREAMSVQAVREEISAPFNLETGPIIRALFIELERGERLLVITLHHIVSDRWSIDVLANDLAALYGAFSRNLPSPLKPLPIQYADFAAWQRGPRQAALLASELEWWLRALRPPLPAADLPIDYVRPDIYDAAGGHERLVLSREVSEALADMARREGATLFMTMLAGAAALLLRYSSQQEIVVGTPIVNRKLPETVPLIGCFVNTLLLRLDASGNPSWSEFLRRVRIACLDAYDHQDLPFEKLVECLQPNRSLSETPLYRVLFAFNDEHEPLQGGKRLQSELVSNGVTLSRLESTHGAVATDLVIRIERRHESTECVFEYRSSLFESGTIAAMLRHYAALLESAIITPNGRLAELSMLTPVDEAALAELNRTTLESPNGSKNVAELFAEQAQRAPDATAVIGPQGELTRGQLDAQARSLAAELRRQSIGPESVVAVCLPRSPEMIAGLLGVLYAGAAYLPLDASYPDERLRWILEHSRAAALITVKPVAARLAFSGPTLVLDSGEPFPPPLQTPVFAQRENLAYLIYTSGSTGQPKGVCIRHAGLSNLVAWHLSAYHLGPSDIATQIASPGFDASVWEIWPALVGGAALHIAGEETRLSPEALWTWLCRHRVTVTFLPTPLAEAILARPLQPSSTLRLMLTGGDRLRHHPPRRCTFSLVNHYGPTEYSVVATAGVAAEQTVERSVRPPSIGCPIANTQVFILDEHLQPVPPGIRGELFIGGEGLARGYAHRADFTAEQFVPHPFSSVPGARLYKTGDRVRQRPDGSLEFLDRLDTQIKIRGFRIELGEIESVLERHPDVREAVIVPIPQDSETLLACYICTPGEGTSADASILRDWLAARLPDYMLPSAWIVLPKLPLNPSGKVDRRALAALPVNLETQKKAEIVPRTKDEEALAKIWAELLPGKTFDVHTDFFAVGGHSLLLAQLVSRIRAQFAIELPLRACFEHRSIAALAACISNAQPPAASAAPPLVRRTSSGPAPLSFAQARLWFIAQLEPESAVYNIPFAVRLRGVLNEAALQRAMDEIVRRHETLRTHFGEESGVPVQRIDPEAHVQIVMHDFSSLPASERDLAARALVVDDARLPFDIANGPLLRAQLIRLEPDAHILLFNLHHIAGDAWSIGILARELAALYAAFASGVSSPLPDLPIQYSDYAAWQREWLRGSVVDDLLADAKSRLEDVDPLELPYDRARPATPSYRAAAVPFEIAGDVWTQLQSIAQSEDATSFMLFFAAWGLLLSRLADRADLILGTDAAERDRLETEPLIGFFVNQLAIPLRVRSSDSFHVLLRRARASLLNAYAHRHLPFELLVDALSPDRDLSGHPLFQSKIVLEDRIPALDLPGIEASLFTAGHATIKTDLRLVVRMHPDSVTGRMEYALDLLEQSTAAAMIQRFITLIEAVAAAPYAPLASIPLISGREQQMLLTQAVGPSKKFSCATVLDMFEEQVRRAPEATAVICHKRALSYAALNSWADAIAAALLALGAGPEVLVAICLPRSELAVVAIWSVLKTGAAYVPLDPGAPSERLIALAQSAGISILVTTEARETSLRTAARHTLSIDSSASPPNADRLPSRARIDAATLAYVIFTSGSTGTPKAAGIEHRNLLNYVQAISPKLAPIHERSFALISTLAADLGNTTLFPSLCGGGCLHIIPEDLATNPDEFAAHAQTHAIDCMKITPSHLTALLASSTPSEAMPRQQLVLGGEASSSHWVSQLKALRPECRILNHYGPTETTIGVLTAAADEIDLCASANLPIGKPLANVSAYVLDGNGFLAPEGVPGELYIGGASVGRGYLNAPALTADRFVPDPYSSTLGARMYRTGDRVRSLGHGVLCFLGRVDRQFKLRGYRVEPGEIESALNEHPAVKQSAVAIYDDPVRGPRLVAWFVPSRDVPQPDELRSFLAKRLPVYMTPSHFVQMDRLPLFANGKLDRRALPAPSFELATDEPGDISATPTEQVLCSIWQTVLGIDRVSPRDNFFRLGGHSLLATRVASRIRETFGIALHVRAVFETPTLSGLASQVDDTRRASAGIVPPPLTPAPRDIALPLSFAEQRLWFIQRLAPEDRSYLVPLVVRVTGHLSAPALEEAFTRLVSRHEILRTTFPVAFDLPRRSISAEASCPLPCTDLRSENSAATETALRARIETETRQPFDLASGPLFRAQLYRTGETEHVLLIVLHHIISDGWSSGLLVSELTALYSHFVSISNRDADSRPLALPRLAVQYADFALWQRNWMQGGTLESLVDWWRGNLAGVDVLDLPLDRSRTTRRSGKGAAHRIVFDSKQTRSLKSCAQAAAATDFIVLLAGFACVLARYSQQRDFCIGTPVSGRIHPDIEALLGCFVNTLVLRCRPHPSLSFTAFLHRVRDTALQAWDHQELPFEQLVERLHPNRNLQTTPLFQALFVLQNSPRSRATLDGLRFEQVAFDPHTAKFDLTLVLTETQDAAGEANFVARLEYSADLFDSTTAEQLLRCYHTFLCAAAASADQQISRIPLLDDSQRQAILRGALNASPYARDSTVHELVEQWADLQPNSVALEIEARTTSYAELERGANRLAHYLLTLGVKPEHKVAVFLDRSPELIVTLFAILKAGGAYLPLEPADPATRLALLLQDAYCVLTTSALQSRIPRDSAPVIALDHVAPQIANHPETRPGTRVSANNLAYIMFTSGSTGQPKGVAVEHRSVVRLVNRNTYASLSSAETILQLAPVSFDASTFEIWGALANGGRLAIFPPGAPALGALASFLRQQSISTLWLTAGLFKIMSDEHSESLRNVRQLLAGGDVLPTTQVRRVLRELPNCRLINGYGPTENTTFTCCRSVQAEDADLTSVPIGKPIANTDVYLLDDDLQLLPQGASGELYAAGDGLARGYDSASLTAERFIPHPFSPVPGARLYRTGDWARQRAGGVIEFIGRRDGQVKIRGFRVEMGEIEAAVARHPDVCNAAVIARRNASGDQSLFAFVELRSNSALSELREWMRPQVPDYMIPAYFTAIEKLPLNPNGKVDRKALVSFSVEAPAFPAKQYVAPVRPDEDALVEIWQNLLARERIGVQDDFFELGGHSLLAAQLASRIEQKLGVAVPLRLIFENTTIADLADAIEVLRYLAIETAAQGAEPA